MNKKRLLKDLPFGGLTRGVVLTKGNGGYYTDLGDTIYSEGHGSSHRGQRTLDSITEYDIVDLIWNNLEWFEDADLKAITIEASTDKIVISFLPLDLAQAQTFAKGIAWCLDFSWPASGYTWSEFKDFKIKMK